MNLHELVHSPTDDETEDRILPRVFVREPTWRVACKTDHNRMHCYQVAEGDQHHHRINQGEIYLLSGEEKLCIPCAQRRGLLRFGPSRLRESSPSQNVGPGLWTEPYDVRE
jgi:hypothetical protein